MQDKNKPAVPQSVAVTIGVSPAIEKLLGRLVAVLEASTDRPEFNAKLNVLLDGLDKLGATSDVKKKEK